MGEIILFDSEIAAAQNEKVDLDNTRTSQLDKRTIDSSGCISGPKTTTLFQLLVKLNFSFESVKQKNVVSLFVNCFKTLINQASGTNLFEVIASDRLT